MLFMGENKMDVASYGFSDVPEPAVSPRSNGASLTPGEVEIVECWRKEKRTGK